MSKKLKGMLVRDVVKTLATMRVMPSEVYLKPHAPIPRIPIIDGRRPSKAAVEAMDKGTPVVFPANHVNREKIRRDRKLACARATKKKGSYGYVPHKQGPVGIKVVRAADYGSAGLRH